MEKYVKKNNLFLSDYNFSEYPLWFREHITEFKKSYFNNSSILDIWNEQIRCDIKNMEVNNIITKETADKLWNEFDKI